jgi:hypothetical protein
LYARLHPERLSKGRPWIFRALTSHNFPYDVFSPQISRK